MTTSPPRGAEEKARARPAKLTLPLILFIFPCLLGVLMMPAAVRAMLDFNEWTGFDPDLRLREWMGLAVTMPVVFGLAFQTPLAMAFFTRIGVMTARGYLQYWRHAVLGLGVFAAVITPTLDLITWGYLFGLMFVLYLVGVGVCRMVEPRPTESPPACNV